MSAVIVAARGEGVELRYGDHVAVAASDFAIPSGAVTSLIGPNGSGKSTLLLSLAGLHRPARGRLEVLGTRPVEARRRVAVVMQSTKVNETLPVTVWEVVAMGRYAGLGVLRRFGIADREAVDRALDRLQLADLAGRHLHELSGGQRQRVFVAQGLVQSHDLLLMDEPTTALDLVSMSIISEVIAEERDQGKTIVTTTHDLTEATEADHVVLMAGRVVAQGLPSTALTVETLAEAYRSAVVEIEGRLLIDDAAHRTAEPRHVHIDRGSATHAHDD